MLMMIIINNILLPVQAYGNIIMLCNANNKKKIILINTVLITKYYSLFPIRKCIIFISSNNYTLSVHFTTLLVTK